MRLVKLTSPIPSCPLTKKIFVDEKGNFQSEAYSNAKWFRADTRDINSFDSLATWLRQLKDDPQSALIRGGLDPKITSLQRVRRRIAPASEPASTEAPFIDVPIQWLMIDIDKLPLPQDIDLIDNTLEAVKFAISQLPPEFHDSSLFWQLSSSSGFKSPGTISIHLHYWLSKARTSAYVRAWAKTVNAKKGFRLVDENLYSPVQLHYTAAPLLEKNVIDPLKGKRFGTIAGISKSVDLVEIAYAPRKAHQPQLTQELGSTHGYEQILAEMGDDGKGFYEPILRATSSFAATQGREETELQKEAIKIDIRERIKRADTSNHDQADLDRYASDAFLDSIIDGAIEKFGDKKHLPPHFDTHELSVEQGEAKLIEALTVFGERVKRYWNDSQEWLEDAPTLAIKATAGLGKTSRVIQELINYNLIELGDIHYYAPTHSLIQQLEVDLNEVLTLELDDSYLIRSEVIYGRDRLDRNNHPMCLKSALATKIAQAGLNVSTTLCKSGSAQCEHYKTCGYQKQFIGEEEIEGLKNKFRQLNNAEESTVDGPLNVTYCLTHAHLFLNTKNRLPKPKLVIIDEAFWRLAIEELYISTNDLLMTETPIAKFIHETLVQQCPPPLLGALRSKGFTPDDLRQEATQIELTHKISETLKPNIPSDEILRILGERSAELKAPLVLRQIADELELVGREISHCVRYEPRDVNTDDQKRDKLVLTRRKQFFVSEETPILFLDANASEEILKIFRSNVEVVDIPVQRQATVHQVTDLTFSKSSLTKGSQGNELRAQVKDFIEQISSKGSTLVVSTKSVEDRLKEEVSDIGYSLFSPRPAFAHFGNLRGLNEYANYDNVIVVGREQPPGYAIEDQARALWWDSEFPIYSIPHQIKNKPLPKQYRTYRSDQFKSVQVGVHPDHRVQLILEQSREAENEQALDRLRLLRISRQVPRNVYLLSNLPLDVKVDEFISWGELQRLYELWLACEGVMPLNPAHLMLYAPDQATSERTARRIVQSIKVANSLIRLLISDVATFSYREVKAG